MENAELIKALRCKEYFDLCKDASCKYHVNGMRSGCRCEIKVKEHAAADLIESLQAQLSESQRREQAAVEDLKRFSACCQCNANIDGSCCDMFDGTAENKYFCSNWQWRGPQEAGEGAK